MKKYKDIEYMKDAIEVRHLTQKDISEECGCSIATISKWCDKLGIKPQGYKHCVHDKDVSNHLDDKRADWNDCVDLLDGTILGGASMRPISNSSAVYEVASQDRLYLECLYNQLKSFGIQSKGIRESADRFQLTTFSYAEFFNYWERWYVDKEKHIPAMNLNPNVVLHFYMKKGKFDFEKNQPRITFTMGRFNEKEVDKFFSDLYVLLNTNQDLMIKIGRNQRKELVLRLTSIRKFIDYISGSTAWVKYSEVFRYSPTNTYSSLKRFYNKYNSDSML